MLRPELTHVVAEIQLPAYLNRPQPIHKDIRGGTLTVVNGSTATLSVTASRPLVEGTWAMADRPELQLASVGKSEPSSETLSSPAMAIDASRKVNFQWKDEFGLAGKEPLTVTINAREDEAPSLSCEDLPRQKVVIDSETLTFKVRAQDDFGIKRIGMQWQGADDPSISSPANGDRVIAAGGPEKDALDIKGTFSAKALGIEPQQRQPVSIRG